MADITYCANVDCFFATRCSRSIIHKENPDGPWISVAFFVPDKDGHCDNFIKLIKKRNKRCKKN